MIINSIQIDLNLDKWKKIRIYKNDFLFIYKNMYEYSFSNDFEIIKQKKLPYVKINEKNNKINEVSLSTGLVRAIPLFYEVEENKLIISDNISHLIGSNKKISNKNLKEFLVFGYTLKDKTLFHNIKQIQAGELIKCQIGGGIKKEDYFIYGKSENLNECKVRKTLEEIILNTFELYTTHLKDKKIIVPLSGGYDSRLIITMLKYFGVKDVFCITYGIENNFESKKAKHVSEKLKYPLETFIYNPESRLNMLYKDNYTRYLEYSSQKSTLGHSQEYLMMEHLIKKYNFNRDEVVFIPGHTGDFISGGHIPYDLLKNVNKAKLKELILSKHSLRKYSSELNILNDYNFTFEESYKNYELFDWRERQSKFIVNANRNYDYNGYSWAMPFWYSDYVEFWSSVPLKYKFQKNLYDEYLENNLFKKYGLDFDKNERIKIRKKGMNKYYQFVRKVAKNNEIIKKFYSKLYNQNNPLGIDKISKEILKVSEEKYPEGFSKLNNFLNRNNLNNRANPNAYQTDFYLSKVLQEYDIDEL